MNTLEKTFQELADQVGAAKKDNTFQEVFVLFPDSRIAASFNHFILKNSNAFVNVKINTPAQMFTEKILFELDKEGLVYSGADETRNRMQRIIHGLLKENKLEYFSTADEFHSIPEYIIHAVREIRLNLKNEDLKNALCNLGPHGEELFLVADLYIKDLGEHIDYASGLGMIGKNAAPEGTVILFPGLKTNLSKKEQDLLGIVFKEIRVAAESVEPGNTVLDLKGSINREMEIRDVFRDILQDGSPLEDSVLIVPPDYLELVVELAGKTGLPVRTDRALSGLTPGFKVVEEIIHCLQHNFPYESLRSIFLVRNQIGQLNSLARLGIAEGDRTGRLKEKKELTQSEAALLETLENLNKIKACLPEGFDSAGRLIADFLPDGYEKKVLLSVLNNYHYLKEYDSFAAWSEEVVRILRSIKEKPSDKGLMVATSLLPGLYDHVYMAGLSEGHYPSVVREDPLLSDQDREQLNAGFDACFLTRKAKVEEMEKRFFLTVNSAVKGWHGTFPLADVMTNSNLTPSYYLIEIVRRIKGEDIKKEEYEEYLKEVSGQPFAEGKLPLDKKEWYLQNLFRNGEGSGAREFISHIFASKIAVNHASMEAETWSPKYSGFSGYIGASVTKSEIPVYSATELENVISCPRKWFLKNRIRLSPFDEPVETISPDPAETGTIVHQVLEDYMKAGGHGGIADLEQRGKKEIGKWFAACGETHELLVETQWHKMSGFFKNFVRYQDNLNSGRVPEHFELSFRSSEGHEPVPIEAGSSSFLLTGKIDRIDREGEDFVIIDYKTGKAKNYNKKENQEHAGLYLQPALYARAVKKLLGVENSGIKSGYLFLKGDRQVESLRDYDDRMNSELDEALVMIQDMIDAGFVFPDAGGCSYCEFTSYCSKMIGYSSARQMEGELSPDLKKIMAAYKSIKESAID